jgi:anti-sigma factor RsiW
MTPDADRPPEEDLACREVVEIVSEYLDGTMAPGERRRLEAHLEGCPFCTEYVDQLRAVGRALHTLGTESIGAGRRDALLQAFRSWHER